MMMKLAQVIEINRGLSKGYYFGFRKPSIFNLRAFSFWNLDVIFVTK